MKKNIVGIDISKDKLDYCNLEVQTVAVQQKGVLLNDKKTISKWLKQFDSDQVIFAFEHTGHYGAMLAECLTDKGFKYYLLNPFNLKRSLGVKRGKTDQKDAYNIAEYAILNKHKLNFYKLPTEQLRKLKALITAREKFVKISVQLQNSIKANIILGKTIDLKMLIKEEKKQLKNIKHSIKNIESKIKEVIESQNELKQNYNKITQVIGVGPIIGAKCIAVTNNFLAFKDGRKFSCYSGFAPFAYESGSSVKGKTKTHFLRDKSLKALLIKGAITAIRHDPQLKKYYNRKISEGKHKRSVKNAVANKLVLRIFAVVNREEPFVKLSA
jgi:transposase